MREFAFTIEYDRGVDPVMDVFIEHPEAIGKAISISVSTAGMWRVDRIAGPLEALPQFDRVFLDPTICNECLGPHPNCHTDWEYRVIDEQPEGRTIYTYLAGFEYCHSIPYMAATRLGDGLFFDTQRRGNVYEWRVLLREDHSVGELYDALEADLPEGVKLSLRGIGQSARWGEATVTIADLPYEQRTVLETAISMGYYETPRKVKLSEIADALDIPESTLRYRLRRAEAWLTTNFLDTSVTFASTPEKLVSRTADIDR